MNDKPIIALNREELKDYIFNLQQFIQDEQESGKDIDTILDEIDRLNNTVINARAVNSNRAFRAESAQESLSAEQTSIESVLASIMETDTALALTELLSLQESYQLTLNVVNKAFQRSLVDVLG